MSRELFDEVVGTPPPSTIDVTAIVTRRRRVMVIRRWGVSVASVVAAVMVTVAGLAWAPVGTSLGPPVDPGVPGFSLAMDTEQASAETAVRLTEAFATAIAEKAPQARWLPDAVAPTIRAPTLYAKPGVLFVGDGRLLSEGREGNVNLTIMRDTCGSGIAPSSCVGASPPPGHGLVSCDGVGPTFTCVTQRASNGAALVVRTNAATDPNDMASSSVWAELPGSLVLELSADNIDLDEVTGLTQTRQPNTVLTAAQLTDITRALVERIRP